ncbi:hypothetical protein BP00DRAFT_449063 [Aspergillus indologenus CBS 114.80]|uniref:Uncharacterized protein n=1 Tax=Aspergillus indologenus CBS 114.80 TaxID=1450541 RepID=A0A2V5I0Y9_9EURO|nr:hypothetical protein BP00DRAFT_449063 [Aspergillus indologenus CBS 114.80]
MVSSGLPQLLGYMGSVNLARMEAGKRKVGCFGVITDADQFDFVTLNENRQYSVITYRWKAGQKQQIWDSLNWIVAAAAGQSPQGSNDMEE